MISLNENQKQALDVYFELMKKHSSLFQVRKIRPIVTQREVLEKYAGQENLVLGVAATTEYVYFINDLVENKRSDGTVFYHPYLRVVYRAQLEGAVNTVVFPVIQNPALGNIGDIILLEQERHATATNELELPRGFGEISLSGEENALCELEEETGYVGEKAIYLGSTFTDSGLTDAKVSFYYVPVTAQQMQHPEIEEKIENIQLISLKEVWQKIRFGKISDGFTLQAIALYEKYQTNIK